jgi:hypothetical protein
MLENGAPDTLRCASQAPSEPATLENSRAVSAIIHWTVRYATGLFGEPAEQWLTGANGRLQNVLCGEQCKCKSQRAPDCPVWQDDKAPQRSTAPNPNGCADVACTRQCIVTIRWRTGLSSAPIASRIQPTARSGWEAINTSQPPHSLPSKPSEIFIHCKSKSPTLQNTIKAINPLKAPKSTLVH